MICCKAGDLVIWDSRTVHCNTPASPDIVDTAYAREINKKNKELMNGADGQIQTCANATAQKLNVFNDAGNIEKVQRLPSDVECSMEDARHVIRMVGYICMVPTCRASAKIRKSRILGWMSGTQTSHWPDKLVCCVRLKSKSINGQ